MKEYYKTPREIYNILTHYIFNVDQPCVRAKSVFKKLTPEQVNALLEYLIKYTDPDLLYLADIIVKGINKSDAISLEELELKLNEALDCIANFDVEKLRKQQMLKLKEAAYLDNLIKEKTIKTINNQNQQL